MKTNEFDDLVRQAFDQNDFPYDATHWDGVQQSLLQKRRKIVPIWRTNTGMAAGILLAVGIVYMSISLYNKSNKVAIADKTVSSPVVAIPPIHEEQVAVKSPKSNLPAFIPAHHNLSTSVAHTQPLQALSVTKENDVAATSSSAAFDTIGPAIASSTFNHRDKTLDNLNALLPDVQEPEKKQGPKTIVSIAGGFNYGSLNAGYQVGGNMRHKIGSRMYIEGDIAFVNATRNTLNVAGGGSTLYVPPANGTVSAVSAPPTENRSVAVGYLQLAPALGCEVYKNVSVALAADMQQLIQGDATADATGKSLAYFDFGVAGKVEYALSKKYKAGLQYRHGANEWLDNNKYIDRNYIQVQLKVNILQR